MTITGEIGIRGEEAAANFLLDNGFSLLHRNWRSGRYELDIVAQKGTTIHFIEVKTRKKSALTSPEDAMTRAKFTALCKAASAYISLYHIDLEPQFDLVAVEYSFDDTQIRYIAQVMTPSW